MNIVYASLGITVMDSNGNRRNRNVVRRELLEAIEKQIKWETDRGINFPFY